MGFFYQKYSPAFNKPLKPEISFEKVLNKKYSETEPAPAMPTDMSAGHFPGSDVNLIQDKTFIILPGKVVKTASKVTGKMSPVNK